MSRLAILSEHLQPSGQQLGASLRGREDEALDTQGTQLGTNIRREVCVLLVSHSSGPRQLGAPSPACLRVESWMTSPAMQVKPEDSLGCEMPPGRDTGALRSTLAVSSHSLRVQI